MMIRNFFTLNEANRLKKETLNLSAEGFKFIKFLSEEIRMHEYRMLR